MAKAKFNLLGAEVRAALERLLDVLADLGLTATPTGSGLAAS
ncbi:hypothetical protein AAFX91_40080 [Bradyrhizobium sp. 31Argb]|nr:MULTISPECIES: hypothetical protein [unclassified Bradyrhizobium]